MDGGFATGCLIKGSLLMLEIQQFSCSQALILMGDFRHLDICWENNMVSYKQFRRLLEPTDDNILVHILDRMTRGELLQDLVLINVEEIIKEVKI